MRRMQLIGMAAGLLISAGVAQAFPPVAIGIGIGVPGPYYRPYPYPYRYYYGAPPVYVVPEPVVVQPAPVYVSPQPQIVTGTVPGQVAPAVAGAPLLNPDAAPPVPYQAARPADPNTGVVQVSATQAMNGNINNLRSQDENIRRASVLELGKMRAPQAVQPITVALASDPSPVVREAAARALGLIGSPTALTALMHAAQADGDATVRSSAQFAVDIIRANQR